MEEGVTDPKKHSVRVSIENDNNEQLRIEHWFARSSILLPRLDLVFGRRDQKPLALL